MANNKTEAVKYVETYFNTLHKYPEGLKGGSFAYFTTGERTYEAGLEHAISVISSIVEKKNKPVFVSLNTYKKTKKASKRLRCESNLWGLDTIMIDIDGTSELCGKEDELISVLEFAWNNKKIPEPNLISKTGGGGIHLYYTFKRLPAQMKDSIKALKFALVELLYPFENDFPYIENFKYHIDLQVFDHQRVDRVPGSINPKTGRMCVCYVQRKERYTYKELLEYCDEDKWTAERKINDVKNYITNYNKPKYRKMRKNGCITSEELAVRRIERMTNMVKEFRNFTGRREIICFMIRNWCYQLKYSDERTKDILMAVNNNFSEPLPINELIGATKVKKVYFFSNKYIKDVLNLSKEETKIFFGDSYRPGDQKQKSIEANIVIASLTLQGLKGREIAELTGYHISKVKIRRAKMKKNEGLEYWAHYEEYKKKEESNKKDIENEREKEDELLEPQSVKTQKRKYVIRNNSTFPIKDIMKNYDNQKYDKHLYSVSEYDACVDCCEKKFKLRYINTSLRSSSRISGREEEDSS